MKKTTFLALILSLLLISLVGVTNVRAGEMPEEPGGFAKTASVSCSLVKDAFSVRLFEADEQSISVSFWYIKAIDYPVVVIFDIQNEVIGIYVKPKNSDVLFFPSNEEALASIYPRPCTVWDTYVDRSI